MKTPEMGAPTPEKKGRKFYHLTPEQFATLPDGTKLRKWALLDTKQDVIKGKDAISDEVYHGFLGYGLFEEEIPEGMEVDKWGMDIEEEPTEQ